MKMVKKYWLFLMLTTFVVSCRNSNVGVSKDADDQRIVLTNGFIKKTQKTPPQEIEKAKRYRADYLSRRRETK